jgi:ubiquitin-activating enzyme E1
MASISHLLPFILGFFSVAFGNCHFFAEAGWRKLSTITRGASASHHPPTTLRLHPTSSTEYFQEDRSRPSKYLSSLFGVANSDLIIGQQKRRHLASFLVATSFRGGADDDDVDDDDHHSDISQHHQEDGTLLMQESNNNDSVDNSFGETTFAASKRKDDNDDERYSRQMYTLGARAHNLVRSTTAILDGPLGGKNRSHIAMGTQHVRWDGADGFEGVESSEAPTSETPSGLLYEISKNLALSGVGRIILVQDDNDDENGYFDGSLDDLGAAYHRAALEEISVVKNCVDKTVAVDESGEEEGNSDVDEQEVMILHDGAILLAEFIQRLNPGVQVCVLSRSKLMQLLRSENLGGIEDDESDDGQDNITLGNNPVVVCVDRSITAQLEMNDACRDQGANSNARIIPFLAVETAGVHAKLFCDFGPKFTVVDDDGETPRSTLIDRIEEVTSNVAFDDINQRLRYTVHCIGGERHDVSSGDVIEFQLDHSDYHGATVSFPKCQVVSVKSPTSFVVTDWVEDTVDNKHTPSSILSLTSGKARSFSRIKVPKQISFSSLRNILQPNEESITSLKCCEDDTLFAPSDLDKSFDPVRRRAIMAAMLVLDEFVKKYGRLPSKESNSHGEIDATKHKRTDVVRFMSLARKLLSMEYGGDSDNKEKMESLITQFAHTCRAKFTPVQALSGALAAQEVLKAATGLYNPIRQFLLYDCGEVLFDESSEESGEAEIAISSTPPGLSYLLGHQICNKLASSCIFLVGAGAIGCELLKNLAAMGAGSGASNNKQGSIIITDMDTIEKSNLSRQLLFRDSDVGEFKSVAARAATLRFNQNCHVEAHTSRVGEEEDGPFDDVFWSSGCNVVLNALDNVEARLFVDRQCVSHGLGLIDAGTLGPKGNVQVVIPHASESYGSSADPPEPDIPVCTLKNFPYEISHTIQWARDLFDGYFYRRPRQANDHVDGMAQAEDLTAFGQSLIEKLGDDAALEMAGELGEDLGPFPFIFGNADTSDPEYISAVKQESLNWAIRQANNLFYVAMNELLQKHPIDSVDDDGALFWSGARRAPKPLRFIPLDSDEEEVSAQQVLINERIAQFVSSASRLRMESFLEIKEGDTTSLITLEEAFVALQEHALVLEEKKKSRAILHNLSGGGGDVDTLSVILDKLNGAKIGASFLPRLNLADFEKDDESNGHVAFVTAASNLRAMAYGIPPVDAMETRRVAGRIVPAMITTTGLVSALSCLELVKLLKGLPLTMYRNAFVNLALPFFAFTSPMPAAEVPSVNGKTHTIWDRISVRGSSKQPVHSMTLKSFLKKIQKKASCGADIEISSISYGPYMIYANFLHSHDNEMLETPLLESVKDAIISEADDETSLFDDEFAAESDVKKTITLTPRQQAVLANLDRKVFLDFSVTVEDQETGEEYELPTVRLLLDNVKQSEEEGVQ